MPIESAVAFQYVSVIGESDQLRRLSAELERAADDLDRAFAELRAFDRPDVWAGGRARRFRDASDDRRRQARWTADDLRAQAGELVGRADVQRLLLTAIPGR